MRAFVVAAFVPGSVEARRHPPVEPVPPLDADPEVAKLRLVREPMLAHARQQARLAGAADQPARAHMARNGHLVELARAVLAARDVGARAQPPAILQRVLVFPAGPDRDADTGFGLVVRLKGKRKPSDGGVEHDRPLVRLAGDIAVRRQRQADAQAPALSRPHLRQEPVDVEHHRRRRLAGQHLLEMPRGQPVLALQEESPGKLQADAHQAGVPRSAWCGRPRWPRPAAPPASPRRCPASSMRRSPPCRPGIGCPNAPDLPPRAAAVWPAPLRTGPP